MVSGQNDDGKYRPDNLGMKYNDGKYRPSSGQAVVATKPPSKAGTTAAPTPAKPAPVKQEPVKKVDELPTISSGILEDKVEITNIGLSGIFQTEKPTENVVQIGAAKKPVNQKTSVTYSNKDGVNKISSSASIGDISPEAFEQIQQSLLNNLGNVFSQFG